MNHIAKKFIDNGILIGSRQWGGFTKDSDYDLVYSIEKTEKIIEFLFNNKIEYSDNTGSASGNTGRHTMFNHHNLKFKLGDYDLNIISYSKEHINYIIELNKYMKCIETTKLGESVRKYKSTRILTVENYLNFLFIDYQNQQIEVSTPQIRDDIEAPLGAMGAGEYHYST